MHSDDDNMSSDEDKCQLPNLQLKEDNTPTNEQDIKRYEQDIKLLTDDEDEDTVEEKTQRLAMKQKRMLEEEEIVRSVIAKKDLRFIKDKEDHDWLNGPFQKQVSRGQQIKNDDRFEKISSTMKAYTPSASFIMR